jgi:enoyl-CoA hydratase/carnithine racemase
MSDPQATGAVSTFDDGTVQTRELDGILVITINRPNVRNAVDGATARALAEAFDQLDAPPQHRDGTAAHR